MGNDHQGLVLRRHLGQELLQAHGHVAGTFAAGRTEVPAQFFTPSHFIAELLAQARQGFALPLAPMGFLQQRVSLHLPPGQVASGVATALQRTAPPFGG